MSTRARLLTPALVFMTLVTAIISSLGAPLVPPVSTDLHVPLADAQWTLTVALLAGAVSAPILGRIADGPRRRLAIIGGLGVVLSGCVLAAVAGSLAVLLIARAMQGIGLGLVPLAIAAARYGVPPEKRAAAIALLSVSAASGVGIGYPVSGLIAAHVGLSATYWFGAIFTAAALLAAIPILPAGDEGESTPLDIPGSILLSAGLVALLLAIGQGESWGWTSAVVLALVAAAIVLLAAWIRQQLHAAAPLVQLRLLRHPAVLSADACAFLLGVAMYLNLSLVTTFVQMPASTGFGFGASVLTAGLCLVPFSVLSLIASRTLPAVQRIVGGHGVLSVGCLVSAAASLFFALAHGALWEMFVMMAIVGVGLGFTFAAIPGLIVGAVPADETGSAMGFYQVIRYVGFSLGSALASAILAAHTPVGEHLPVENGFVVAAWVAAATCVLAALMAWLLPAVSARRVSPSLAQLETEEGELAAAGLVGGVQAD